MSLIGHQGGLSIGKAERPGPSLGNKVNKDSKSSSDKPSSSYSSSALEQRGLRQMIGGILHSQRRDEAQARAASLDFDSRSETASLSSVATEKRALLAAAATTATKKDKSRSYSKAEPKLPNPNEALMPRNRFWS